MRHPTNRNNHNNHNTHNSRNNHNTHVPHPGNRVVCLEVAGGGWEGHQNVHQRGPATQGLPCRHGRLTFHSCPTPLARRWGQRQHPRPRLQLSPRRRWSRRRLSGTPTPIGMWRCSTPWKRSSTRTAPTFAVVQRCRCPGRTTHPTRSSAFRSPSTRPRCTRRPAWGRCTSAG